MFTTENSYFCYQACNLLTQILNPGKWKSNLATNIFLICKHFWKWSLWKCIFWSFYQKLNPNKTDFVRGRKNRVEENFCLHPYGLEGWFVLYGVCVSVHLSYRKSWITFEQVNGFEWNFLGLWGWSVVTFGWVVLPPSLPWVGPGLYPVLFPEVKQFRGHWCYKVVSYHFGKLLSGQTTMAEQIYDYWVTTVGILRGTK